MFLRLYAIFFIIFFFYCKKVENVNLEPVETVKEEKTDISSPLNLEQFISKIEKNELSKSYQSNIDMVITRFRPKSKKNRIKGFLVFNSKTKRMNIELEDSFFGIKIAKVQTNGKTMQIQAPKQKIINSNLGDIYLEDMQIYLPFRSIYFLLSNQNSVLFKQSANNLNFKNNRLMLDGQNNRFSYYYKNFKLDKIIIEEKKRDLKSFISIRKLTTSKILTIKILKQTKILLVSLNIKIHNL